jgi:hypothetical protein
MPVHDGGAELARRRHLRLELEGPAVGGGHWCDYQLQLGADGVSRDYRTKRICDVWSLPGERKPML